jgi:hypothetical protein
LEAPGARVRGGGRIWEPWELPRSPTQLISYCRHFLTPKRHSDHFPWCSLSPCNSFRVATGHLVREKVHILRVIVYPLSVSVLCVQMSVCVCMCLCSSCTLYLLSPPSLPFQPHLFLFVAFVSLSPSLLLSSVSVCPFTWTLSFIFSAQVSLSSSSTWLSFPYCAGLNHIPSKFVSKVGVWLNGRAPA